MQMGYPTSTCCCFATYSPRCQGWNDGIKGWQDWTRYGNSQERLCTCVKYCFTNIWCKSVSMTSYSHKRCPSGCLLSCRHHLFQSRVLEAWVKARWSYWKDSHESLTLWLIHSLYNTQNVRLTNCTAQAWQLRLKRNTKQQQSALSHQYMPGFDLLKLSQLQ